MKQIILELRDQGKTYQEIAELVNCSKSTVAYYCGNGQKEKAYNRGKMYKKRKKLGIILPKKEKIIKLIDPIKEEIKNKFSHLSGNTRVKAIANYKLMNDDFENIISFDRKRKRIIIEQEEKCNNCGIREWQGQLLSLEIDHIDGNNKNNSRENLEALCPNCHSLTKTWKGRNRKDISEIKYITKENLHFAFLENKGNIRQALLSLNIAAKGGNYQRMYEALDFFKVKYIKQSDRKKVKSKINKFL